VATEENPNFSNTFSASLRLMALSSASSILIGNLEPNVEHVAREYWSARNPPCTKSRAETYDNEPEDCWEASGDWLGELVVAGNNIWGADAVGENWRVLLRSEDDDGVLVGTMVDVGNSNGILGGNWMFDSVLRAESGKGGTDSSISVSGWEGEGTLGELLSKNRMRCKCSNIFSQRTGPSTTRQSEWRFEEIST
jgi:hypothetical protein